MNNNNLSKVQLQCRILADSILMRNAKEGFVSQDVMSTSDSFVREDAEKLKALLEQLLSTGE